MTTQADLIRAVARIHGLPTGPISEPAWPGVVNKVNIVGSGADRYVIRTPRDRVQAEEFAIEAWCARRAREHAIPTADIVGVGVVNAVAYSVQRFVAGANGETVRSAELWRTLGKYARTINTIPLADAPEALFSRFGRDLPAAWRAHLDYNVDSLNDADPLLELGVYNRAEQSCVRDIVESLRYHSFEFGLSHGDLALRNLLVDPGRPPVLIDWGSAPPGRSRTPICSSSFATMIGSTTPAMTSSRSSVRDTASTSTPCGPSSTRCRPSPPSTSFAGPASRVLISSTRPSPLPANKSVTWRRRPDPVCRQPLSAPPRARVERHGEALGLTRWPFASHPSWDRDDLEYGYVRGRNCHEGPRVGQGAEVM